MASEQQRRQPLSRRAGIEQADRLFDHQIGGLGAGMGAGDGELNALVFADRAVEDPAFAGVRRRLGDEPPRVADGLGGDQDALGVEAVEQIPESLALFADQITCRHT